MMSSTELADRLISGNFAPSEVIPRLTEMARRGETVEEVMAMAKAFQGKAVRVRTKHPVVLDLCGTGGARFRTFNVSTTASFVVSALGVPVAKHGNRSSRGCGSADLLESLGARLSLSPDEATASLDRSNFVFLFAPRFHPAMRSVAQVRRDIGGRTVFNLLGPLLNPVMARRRQLIGVYSPKLLDLLPPVLIDLGVERALLVHGQPGMDEVSVVGQTNAVLVEKGRIERFIIDPREMGLFHPDRADISELPAAQSSRASLEVLGGAVGAKRDMVVLNAACGLLAFGACRDLDIAVRKCEGAIDSGRALEKLRGYIAATAGTASG